MGPALLDHGYCVYPINPKSADHFRKAMSAAGRQVGHAIDRHVPALHLKSCHSKLRRLKPDDPATLVALRIGCQDRIRLVEEKTAKLNELIAGLKTYYPAILGLFGDVDSQISPSSSPCLSDAEAVSKPVGGAAAELAQAA
ncbi:MAG: hypothetical protein IPK83_01750 [Planctomycetes bacterium]|nr:hypothetical protein [Planctomycetota bacterium]